MTTCYDADFYSWTNEQAALLRSRKLAEIDIENIAEEIEDMGRNLYCELVSRLEILFIHLLKWQFQPSYQSNSWRYTIEEQREKIADHLEDNPGLTHKLPDAIGRAYKYAIRGAAKETGLAKKQFPQSCPWSFGQAMDNEFWPESSD